MSQILLNYDSMHVCSKCIEKPSSFSNSESNQILTCSVWVQIWWLDTWNSTERVEGGTQREQERKKRDREGGEKWDWGSCNQVEDTFNVWQLKHE